MKGQEGMEASKKIVVGYAVHDIIGNNEQCLTEYDPDVLQRAEDTGLIFVAQYDDGSREVVKAADVRKPDPTVNGIPLATAGYVDERTAAAVAVFDALSAIVDPQPATADETGEGTEAVDPVEAFRAALAALKALEAK